MEMVELIDWSTRVLTDFSVFFSGLVLRWIR